MTFNSLERRLAEGFKSFSQATNFHRFLAAKWRRDRFNIALISNQFNKKYFKETADIT